MQHTSFSFLGSGDLCLGVEAFSGDFSSAELSSSELLINFLALCLAETLLGGCRLFPAFAVQSEYSLEESLQHRKGKKTALKEGLVHWKLFPRAEVFHTTVHHALFHTVLGQPFS